MDELRLAADQASGTPGEAIVAWLRRFAVSHHSKHPIGAELLRHVDAARPVGGGSRARVLAAATIQGEPSYVGPILRAVLAGLGGSRALGPAVRAARAGCARPRTGRALRRVTLTRQ